MLRADRVLTEIVRLDGVRGSMTDEETEKFIEAFPVERIWRGSGAGRDTDNYRCRMGEQTAKPDKLIPMGQLRSCVVSYHDNQGIRHSVEVTADTLYEAAVLWLKALDVNHRFTHNITIDVRVKNPETTHSVSGAALEA